jgi:hypothetical protein
VPDEQCISWRTHDGGIIFFSDRGTRSGCQLVSFHGLNIEWRQFDQGLPTELFCRKWA